MHDIFRSFLRDLETHVKDAPRNEEEEYHFDCYSSCSAINTALNKLKVAQECIGNTIKFSPEIDRIPEYLEFNIENYLIRSRSVYDRVLIFTNYLCDIQMAIESVNHQSIITNRKVINSGLQPLLKRINKTCGVYRVARNGIIHHDKYHDKNLAWIDVAWSAHKLLNGDVEQIGISKDQVYDRTVYVIRSHLEEYRNNTSKIIESVNEFLDVAMKIYDVKSGLK